jgi:PAS domain S-box-containing protein
MTRSNDLEMLRLAAEARLKHRCVVAEAETEDVRRLLHELQVHQIELEMQNAELVDIRAQLENSLARYTELYDFAPVGYFTLDRRGAILQLNLAVARLLGSTRAALTGTLFSSVVEPGYQATFADMLHRAAVSDVHESCELALARPAIARFVHIEIAPSQADVTLRAVVVDITERVETEQRYKALSLRLLEAQESARRQLAGELHDRTSANLAALVINLDVAEMALKSRDWQEVGARMHDNRALVQDTEASIREICAQLRPPALDYAGLAPAIEAYAGQFSRRTGIAVRLECPQTAVKLPAHLESTLFRIVQEALNNVAKHAAAKAVNVTLQLDRETVRLSVSDDGIGIDPARLRESNGRGIITMREMAEFIGASFELLTRPGNGVEINVALPCSKLTA